MEHFLEKHSGELIILVLTALLLSTLLILVPKLLRAHQRVAELLHTEHMKSLERGLPIQIPDERFRMAGRTASLVPMVVVCAAGTVTCFLAGYKSEDLFRVSLAVWSVAGVVGLAAITGSITLMARLAHLPADDEVEEEPDRMTG